MLGRFIIPRKGSGTWMGKHNTIDAAVFGERLRSVAFGNRKLLGTHASALPEKEEPVSQSLRRSPSDFACMPPMTGSSPPLSRPTHPASGIAVITIG